MDNMQRYISPVNPNLFGILSLILFVAGTIFTAYFFVLEVSREKNSKQNLIFKELLIGLFASIFLGCGTVFLLNSVGIYV